MSDSSDEGDQRKAESSSRMWAESQPGPSRCPPSRQGYCGYCRVLYSNLDQHLSSLRHLDSVRASSRGSSTVSSSTSSSRTKLTLLERFLQDVLQHHPHRYNDPRPSHGDLPSVSAPPLPRAELDELRFSDDDSRSLGTREHLSSSDDASCRPTSRKKVDRKCSQPGEGVAERSGQERLSVPIREQKEGGAAPVGHTQSSHVQTPPPHHQTMPLHQQAPPSVHRKAHRKTNRRKTSESSTSSPPHRGPNPSPYPDPNLCPDPVLWPPTQLKHHPDPGPCPGPGPCPDPGPRPPTKLRPHPGPGPQPPTQLRPCLDPDPCLRPGPWSPTQLKPHPDPSPCSGPGPQSPIQLKPHLGPAHLPLTQLTPLPRPGPWSPTQLRPHLGPGPLLLTQQKPHPDPGPCPDPDPQPPTKLRPYPDPSTYPGPGHRPPTQLRPCLGPGPCPGPGPRPPTQLRSRPGFGPCPGPGTRYPTDPGPCSLRPWLSWQKERREAQKEEAFSSDHSDSLDRTIEEVIQVWCHGVSSTSCQQEETESFHFSLPVSMETQSDEWDSPVQPGDSPVQVSQVEGQDLSRLMDVQVDLEDQVYSYQLDSALRGERRAGGGVRQDEGFWNLPIEEVLPALEHIPESFRGKTWTQIEQEDEEKVEKLVRQFRRGRFICYFDTESLARCGRRSQNKGCVENREAEPDTCILPLLDCDDDDSADVRRRRRRAFRVASRCQVVKVSHSTQTVHVVVPAVRQPASKAPPTNPCVPDTNQDAAERTPEVTAWRCLPPSYSSIVTPLQPRTSLVYLLCSPSGPANTPALGSTPKRCRKKRRPLDPQGSKVKYKQLPVRFYDPSSNRILKNPPKGFQSGPPPPCVRQLFRSLSPDLNTDRPPGECAAGSSRVKGQRSTDKPFSHTNTFLLSTLSRDSAQTDKQDTVRRRGRTSQAPPPPPHSRSDRGRGGRRDRTRLLPSKRRTRAQATPPQATPPQPRREGLRRAGPGRKAPGSPDPPPPPSPRRGRTRRGRGYDRGRR